MISVRIATDCHITKVTDLLSRNYGDESWRSLYRPPPQEGLSDSPLRVSYPEIEGCAGTYKQEHEKVFGDRFLEESLRLKNSDNAIMCELVFCCYCPSPNAIGASNGIAKHLVQAIQEDG